MIQMFYKYPTPIEEKAHLQKFPESITQRVRNGFI